MSLEISWTKDIINRNLQGALDEAWNSVGRQIIFLSGPTINPLNSVPYPEILRKFKDVHVAYEMPRYGDVSPYERELPDKIDIVNIYMFEHIFIENHGILKGVGAITDQSGARQPIGNMTFAEFIYWRHKIIAEHDDVMGLSFSNESATKDLDMPIITCNRAHGLEEWSYQVQGDID